MYFYFYLQAILLLLLLSCGVALSVKQCCPGGEIVKQKGYCNAQHKVDINCSNGRLLLEDIILDGDKVSTQDSPGFIFVEDPSQ